MATRLLAIVIGFALSACNPTVATPVMPGEGAGGEGTRLRVATFNVSLYRDQEGVLIEELRGPPGDQLKAIATIIEEVDPDILVLNEFDYDAGGEALDLFADGLPIAYPHRVALASNTGEATGLDLDGDGTAEHPVGERAYGNDAFGYGAFPGQYAIALLSKHPIEEGRIRTFRKLKWQDMPANLLPADHYAQEAREILRLSSKTHAVVPVQVEDETVHMVLAHPTPPGFDGPEDRNGRRNHDEIRLLEAIIAQPDAAWLKDDQGGEGGLAEGAYFVIAGDLNADPADGDRVAGTDRSAIEALLSHPLTTDPGPRSAGGSDAAERQKGKNPSQSGDPALDTADFSDRSIGNLRVDYVIPSANMSVESSGVFWPAGDEPLHRLTGPGYPPVSSDHRLVWVDLVLPRNR
jgi:3-phytase